MNTEEKGSDFPKAGFSRLIRLFENTDDVVKLTRAFGLASKVHRGQLFNRSEPYINHSLRVAMILVEELQIRDPQIVCAALLHDATDASDEEIRDCGEVVLALVRAAAEPKANPEDKEKSLAEYFKKIAQAPREARCIRIADRLDSVRSMKGQATRAAKYREEIEKYVVPLANATDDRLAFKLSLALYELK
ncbi:MAG TPA: HD domain-containing protein [Nitrososphaera sp.]|nr:HD domain-containing protein [Nitrososphaera sp.]